METWSMIPADLAGAGHDRELGRQRRVTVCKRERRRQAERIRAAPPAAPPPRILLRIRSSTPSPFPGTLPHAGHQQRSPASAERKVLECVARLKAIFLHVYLVFDISDLIFLQNWSGIYKK
uniref:Uncharacterized protein n=1 Tax=Steinernema glaseri TaxID=37863 RepID=A0A1I7XZS6_9BILA